MSADSAVATLYVVGTPIGNLADLSTRAVDILIAVDRILAEDTRRSGILLRDRSIHTPVVSLHAHNEAERTQAALGWLDEGDDLALVSDAGTPVVSDPGRRLVEAVWEAGHRVVPVPGPSAVTAALAVSGFPADRFTFLGFVPRKGRERSALLDRIAGAEETVVLFESPERLGRLLEQLASRCEGARSVAVARELTKLHEEVFRGTLTEAARYYRTGARGEVTVVVEPTGAPPPGSAEVDREAGRLLARALLADGGRPSRVAREVAKRLGIPRNAAYTLVQEEAEGDAG